MDAGGYRIVDNPAYAGKKPRVLTPACHDGTPFVTIECTRCNQQLHVHESQLEQAPTAKVGTVCPLCKHVIAIEAVTLQRAFARMREEGWLA